MTAVTLLSTPVVAIFMAVYQKHHKLLAASQTWNKSPQRI
jgi:hypothetical protein